tara:strand:- start:1302 stop:1814 length:513 start_codon:yes stop_codon:yes gene_type:complete
MFTSKPLLPALAIALLMSCWAAQVSAQADAHDHDAAHAHEEHGGAALSLNNGEQWETDEALRHGMLEIRAAVAMLAPAFASGQLNQTQAQQLSEAVHGSVNTMIEQCKLAPEADANLHTILAELLKGSAALEAAPLSADGLPVLQGALESYGHYFNHVGWQGDEHAGHAH